MIASPPIDQRAVITQFGSDLQPAVKQVLEAHPGLPRPGIDDYPAWVTGCLGDPEADVWFIAENPSIGMALRTIAGVDADVEDQWCTSAGDKLFRQTLLKHRFKNNEWDGPGGWCCYITDVVKSAYIVKDWNAKRTCERNAIAEEWAPVLACELAIGRPRLIVTLGGRARDLLKHVERAGMLPGLPAAREHIHHYVYVTTRPEGKVRGGHPDRIAAWDNRFAEIAQHPARRQLPEDRRPST